jgi:chemotaxis protein histidine kinase CheA
VCTIAEDAHQWDERIRIERRVNPSSGTLHIVVVKTNARMYALLVHEIHGTAGVSVKPVGRGRKLGKGYMGTAMLGNGRTAYVLDPVGIAILAGIA